MLEIINYPLFLSSFYCIIPSSASYIGVYMFYNKQPKSTLVALMLMQVLSSISLPENTFRCMLLVDNIGKSASVITRSLMSRPISSLHAILFYSVYPEQKRCPRSKPKRKEIQSSPSQARAHPSSPTPSMLAFFSIAQDAHHKTR